MECDLEDGARIVDQAGTVIHDWCLTGDLINKDCGAGVRPGYHVPASIPSPSRRRFLSIGGQSFDMAAPTGSDGLRRAVEEVLLPLVGLIVLVVFIRDFLGPVMAGVVYLLLTGVVLLGIYAAAKFWNLNYMGVFVVSGIALLFVAPGIVSELVHPVVGFLEGVIILVFLVGMVLLFVEKSGLGDLLNGL